MNGPRYHFAANEARKYWTKTVMSRDIDSTELREKPLKVRSLAGKYQTAPNFRKNLIRCKRHRHVKYSLGEKVKVFIPNRIKGRSEKLILKWLGPYTIIRKVDDVGDEMRKSPTQNFKLEIVHVDRILPYHDAWNSPCAN
ncbi:hypothetical protein HHI36_013148 [Cryptolaemus montrouzieri]|uniref:Uncharacterized protein n=1 Tax=Cryptolaemus montrouzieri TaxID=559131 RepID=A0ABD2NG97_9CUCU